jgi:TolB-like protein
MRLALLTLLLTVSTASAARAATPPTVAVFPFRDLSSSSGTVGEAIRETVTADLKALGGVRVVERAALERVLGEQHLQGGAEVDPATAARVGKLLGATLIATGAYQKVAAEVRLTGRFVAVETGEIVGTAKVDGRAGDFLRLQDRVTAELLRSAGLAQHAATVQKRARPSLKSLRAVELYGDAVIADSDDKKVTLLQQAVAEDGGFTYAAADLLALEQRMRGYERRAQASQTEKAQKLLEELAQARDPNQLQMLLAQAFSTLQQARRYRAMQATAHKLATGPQAATVLAMGARVDEMALMYLVTAESMLKLRDEVLRDGEQFLKRFPASVFFQSVKMAMDGALRERRDAEDGKAKVRDELARMSADWKWDLCSVAMAYARSHRYVEAQRLFRGCFTVGGVQKASLPTLIHSDMELGDWTAARRDVGLLEKADPEMYRNMKTSYDLMIPVDG